MADPTGSRRDPVRSHMDPARFARTAQAICEAFWQILPDPARILSDPTMIPRALRAPRKQLAMFLWRIPSDPARIPRPNWRTARAFQKFLIFLLSPSPTKRSAFYMFLLRPSTFPFSFLRRMKVWLALLYHPFQFVLLSIKKT